MTHEERLAELEKANRKVMKKIQANQKKSQALTREIFELKSKRATRTRDELFNDIMEALSPRRMVKMDNNISPPKYSARAASVERFFHNQRKKEAVLPYNQCVITVMPKKRTNKNLLDQYVKISKEAHEFYNSYSNKGMLCTSEIAKCIIQASVLDAVLEVRTRRKAYKSALGVVGLDMWQSLSNDVNALRHSGHFLPTTKEGLKRIAKAYRKNGFIALIPVALQNANKPTK